MESQYLKTILTVVETGSFSRAAEILCITQSAVSHRVKFLEDSYCCQLIDRSGPVLMPTEAGKRVISRASQILKLESDILQDLKRMGEKSRLSICSTPTFGIHYLPKVMNKFFFANSGNVDLNFMLLTPDQAIKAVQENEFDLGVIEHHTTLDFKGFAAHSMPEDEMIFIARAGSGLNGDEVSVDQLKMERLITRKTGCSCRGLLDANFAACGIDPSDFKGICVFDDLQFMIQAALEGQGIAFVSRCLVTEYLRTGELTAHLVTGFQHTRFRTLFHKQGILMDKNARFLKELLLDVFTSPPMPGEAELPEHFRNISCPL
jgi:DNA-binding transcriptional LysR family regulator